MTGTNQRSYDPVTGKDIESIGGKLKIEAGGSMEGVINQLAEMTFTETGAGTYTASVTLPAGSTILDIIVHAVALWDAATSAALNIGDAVDPDGFFAAVNLKATDLLAGESLSFAHAGGKQGADLDVANGHVRRRYLATERVVSAVAVSVGAGTAGRTRVIVVFATPATEVVATKV